MLATTFSAVAADASIAPDKVEAGSYYYIGNTDGYLTIGENGAKTAKDSIMFSQKANADLWTLTKGGYDEATGVQFVKASKSSSSQVLPLTALISLPLLKLVRLSI